MSWLDQFLAGVFPSFQMRRIQAKKISAAFEQAKDVRQRRRRRETRDPNSPIETDHANVREMARALEQNNPVVVGALDTIASRVVGMCIVPEPMALTKEGSPATDFNDAVTFWHERWRRRPEVTWELDEGSAQRLQVRTWMRDGEGFGVHHPGSKRGLEHGSEVPYSYELIEPDLLPYDHSDQSKGVIQSIGVNAWRRPTMYHVLKFHPGEQSIASLKFRRGKNDFKRVPRQRMSHVKTITRIGQIRGVSRFATVVGLLEDINEIDSAEVLAVKIASFMAAYIKKGDGYAYTAPITDDDGNPLAREIDLHEGMIFDDLQPGEDVGIISNPRPNAELPQFREMLFADVAAGVGTSKSSLTKNYNGTYSAQRQEMVEQRDLYGVLWSYFVEHFEREKYEHFITALLASGELRKVAGMSDVDPRTMSDCMFSRPAMPWIEPLKEAKGWETLLATGLESKRNIQRSRGQDPRKIERERDEEGSTKEAQQAAQPQPQPGPNAAPVTRIGA